MYGYMNSRSSMSTRIADTNITPTDTPRKVLSSELLQGEKQLIIHHAGAEYVLQVTRAQKLILTK
jgi:hemin uptake protein HemP